ncbi:CAP domain-containing protein [Pseudonocardia sp. TRM90224]|uniref:CAP domain-containing protein n=1 Tax=Pseudonocardia sp. TRM90224 TaxID=2812678 RepID=UPI001E4E8792|nr:CAP domain-containing protein [Pseudonocardia sp. TRM90224]
MTRKSRSQPAGATRRATRLAARGIAASAIAASVVLTLGGPAFAAPLPTLNAAQQQEILAKHNAARADVGVPALTWDAGLAADAQAWAEHLGSEGGKLVHAENTGQGENLYRNSDAGSDPSLAVGSWVAERPNYAAAANKVDYDKDTNPAAANFGHWTQVVWKNTTAVGCGTATGAFGAVTACRYAPPGNFQGQLPYPGADQATPTNPEKPEVNEADCAYNPGGRGGLGSYVDGLALDVRDWEAELTDAINAFRKDNGVPELTYSRQLARPAMWASLDDFNRGDGPIGPDHLDSRGMDVPARVKYCSGYEGNVYEIAYFGKNLQAANWQSAFEFWTTHSRDALLDPSYTTFSGAQMAYGGDDVNRNPAYYTLVLGDH